MRSTPSSVLGSALVMALAASGCGGDDTGAGGSTASSGGSGGQGQGGVIGQGGDGAQTSTASSTSTTSSTSTSTSTGSGAISCPGGGYASFPQSEACDMLQQDCEPGFTCERRQSGGATITQCVPRGGLKGVASACQSDKECESGLFCAFDVCTPVCCPATSEPCGGGNCNLNFSYSDDDVIRLCTYTKQCEPLTEDACEGMTGCHFEEPTVATCIQGSGNNVAEGGACTALNDCEDMQQCSPLDQTCRWICALEDNGLEPGLGGCPSGQTCVTTQVIGIAGIGICRLD